VALAKNFFIRTGTLVAVSVAGFVGCVSTPEISVEDAGAGGKRGSEDSGIALGDAGGEGSDGGENGEKLGPNSACATDNQKAEPLPLDMALLVDTSYSMDFENKWPRVSDALRSFAAEPAFADLGVALQFFPLRKQCSISDYKTPAVQLGLLSEVESLIASAIDAQRMSGGTPLVQVLEGMGEYMRDLATDAPDHQRALVLVTDGIPDNTCNTGAADPPNNLTNAAKMAEDLAQDEIPVFVIGVGDELGALDAIAKAGGTDEAILVSTSGNVQKALFDALTNVRQRSLSCDYPVPPPTKGNVDFENVNVRFIDENGDAENLVYVGRKGDCALAGERGWYYDDEKKPTNIVLCASTCERVRSNAKAEIEALYGCARIDVVR